MNSFIIENIETYTKQSKPKKYKSIQSPEIRLLSESEKIELCMSFIQKILSIPQKNHYMKKLIQEYSREARIDENNLFLYEKNSDKEKLKRKTKNKEITINFTPILQNKIKNNGKNK